MSSFCGTNRWCLLFDSNLIQTLAVILTWSVARILYELWNKKEIKNTAAIILWDIRNADQKVSILINDINNWEKIFSILEWNNRAKYSHIIAKKFDLEEMQRIWSFYQACLDISKSLEKLHLHFSGIVLHKANENQTLLVSLAKEFNDLADYNREKAKLLNIIETDTYWFQPDMYTKLYNANIQNFHTIMDTPLYEKLKKLSR